MHSRPNDVYRLSYVGVPCIRLGYADMNFLLAEAVERGWITGSAKHIMRKAFELLSCLSVPLSLLNTTTE